MIIALCLALFSGPAPAQDHLDPDKPQIMEFRDADKRYVENAVTRISDMTARFYGSALKGEPEKDVRLIQRLLDDERITSNQLLLLQSAGIALGVALANDRRLRWIRYSDKQGTSRALLIKETGDIVFPATIISRRFKVGLDVNVRRLYDKTASFVDQSRQIAAETY